METGTEILIARMASHPEEFVEGLVTLSSKWSRVMNMTDCLPEEDKQALKQAYDRAKIDHFNGEVLATLAGEREPLGSAENTIRYQAKDRYATGLTDPRNLFSTSIGNGTISATAYPAQARAFE
jgi:hypothetical protein